jgi:macrolide-specific efflux system membrane fusion protein
VIAHIKRSYWVLATVLAFLGAATFFARWWAATDTPGYSRLGKANPAPQALAETKPLAVRVTGELAALNAVDVRSTLAGSVSAIRFKTGERVPANSIVAMVEPSNGIQSPGALEAALQRAQDDWTKKKEQAAAIESELARAEEWQREDLIARRDLEQTNAQADLARAQLRLAQARVAQQQAMLAQRRALERQARILAPIAGVVVHRWLDVGATVNEATAILSIADVDRLKLISRISAREATEVRAGMTARVTTAAASGKTFSGKVVRVSRASEVPEQTEIEIEVTSDDGGLRPGMVVEATVGTNPGKDRS